MAGLKIERNFTKELHPYWELPRLTFPWRWNSAEVIQNSNTIHHANENVRFNP